MDRSKCIFVDDYDDIQVTPVICRGISPNILLCHNNASYLYFADRDEIRKARNVTDISIFELSKLPKPYLAYLQDNILVRGKSQGLCQPHNMYNVGDISCAVNDNLMYFTETYGVIQDNKKSIFILVNPKLTY